MQDYVDLRIGELKDSLSSQSPSPDVTKVFDELSENVAMLVGKVAKLEKAVVDNKAAANRRIDRMQEKFKGEK